MSQLRRLPAVGHLLQESPLAELTGLYGREALRVQATRVLDAVRAEIRIGIEDDQLAERIREIPDRIRAALEAEAPPLRRVLNATGIFLHTNLGRAPLPREVVANLADRPRRLLRSGDEPRDGGSQRPRPTCREPVARPHRRRGGPGRQQQRRRAGSRTLQPGIRPRGPAFPAANWSRSAVRSGFRTSSRRAARAWSRSARRTAPASPTTSAPSDQASLWCSRSTRATTGSRASSKRSNPRPSPTSPIATASRSWSTKAAACCERSRRPRSAATRASRT